MSSNPPGLESYGKFQVYSSGGGNEWLNFDKTKLYTNAYVISGGKVSKKVWLKSIDLDKYICRFSSGSKSEAMENTCEVCGT
jgi:hypothetical protein